ncbi:MAG: MATE family efflux transporter [Alphaproteobacteria bacterium]|nr:MAG: MATE family efflux transporter [Alphaproteobacteria bacterium]
MTLPPMPMHPDRRIWRIAGPAMLSNSSAGLVGLVDTWAIGHLPAVAALAALAVTMFVFAALYWTMGFLRMSTTGLVAQAFGARATGRMVRVVARSLLLALVVGAGLLAIKAPFTDWVLAAMDVAEAPAGYARLYLAIRLYSLPFALVKLAVIGFLIGTQRAATAMALEVMLNLLNAVLTVWFVVGLGWGIAGAAGASLIAEAAAGIAGAGILFAVLPLRLFGAALRHRRFWRFARFRALLAINGYLFLRALLLLTALGMFLRWAGGMGEDVLAATHVLLQFHILATLGLDGIAYAAEALVGAAVGRHDRAALRFWALRTTGWAVALAVLYAGLFALQGDAIVAFFTDLAPVRRQAGEGMLWLALLPVVAVWSYQLDGIFIGATGARTMMWTMLATLGFYGLAGPPLIAWAGIDGLWGSFLAFMAVRGLTLGAAYPALERRVAGSRQRPGGAPSTAGAGISRSRR